MQLTQNHINPITGYQTSPQKEKDLEHHFYSTRCYTDLAIRLDREHCPIHPDVCINTQKDYDYHIALLNYLYSQIDMGFKPKWLVTLHYQHPTEHAKPFKETNKLFGFGDRINFKTRNNIWFEDALYKYWDAKRNDQEQVEKDAGKVKCRILRYLFNIKRLDRPDKYDMPNLYIFNEKGKAKQKYHTHIVLPDTLCYNNKEELYDVFNTSIKKRLQCTSKWNDIRIDEINSMYGMFSYLNKETNSNFVAFDTTNSIPIKTKQ